MPGNTIKLTRAIAGKGAVARIPQPTFRQGTVTAVSTAGVPTVTIGADPQPVVAVGSDANYIPAVGDTVNLKVTDTEVEVDGMVGNTPTVFRNVKFATVVTSEKGPNGAVYGDCATVGPTITGVTVGASGNLKVTISDTMTESDNNDGGFMSVDLILAGTTVVAASDAKALAFFPKVTGAYWAGSRVLFYTGLTSGTYTVTARYRDSGGDNLHSFREVLVEPM